MSAPIPPMKKKIKEYKGKAIEKMVPKLGPQPRNQRAAETAAQKRYDVSPYVGTTTADSLKARQDATAGKIRKIANNTPKTQGY